MGKEFPVPGTLSVRKRKNAWARPEFERWNRGHQGISNFWLGSLQRDRSADRYTGLRAYRGNQRCGWAGLSFDHSSGRCSQPDAIRRGRKHRRRTFCFRCGLPRHLQSERDRLGTSSSKVRHFFLVVGVLEPRFVPVPGQVRCGSLSRNDNNFWYDRTRVVARHPSLDFTDFAICPRSGNDRL